MSRIIITKIEMTKEEMKLLKKNKEINGLKVGWQLSQAVKEYIDKHQLKELKS